MASDRTHQQRRSRGQPRSGAGARGQKALRSLASGLILLCVVGQALSLAHLWLIGHAVCPEHGEIYHTAAGAQTARQELTLAAKPTAAAQAAASANDDEHEHCPSTCPRPHLLTLAPATTAQRAAPVTPRLLPSQPPLAPRPIALLRVAPKNSPPV